MTTSTLPPPDAVTAAQRAGWGAQAPHWYALIDIVERQWAPLSDGLLDLARVAPGDRVLDLASGAGDPALAAARRVGPTGSVLATDLSPDMLANAARRAAAAGLAQLTTHEMDAQAVDLPDGSVDAVLCRLGLMFVPDLDRALGGVARVLVPGGRFAAAIPWRPAEQAMPRLAGALLAALDLPAPPPATPGVPGIFSLADASVVCAALDRAGLVDVRVVPYTVGHDWTDVDEWFDFLLALNVPLRAHLAGVSEERIRTARRVAADATGPYRAADGHLRFDGYGYYATATRPAR